MGIFKFLQNSFTTGQLSPLLGKRSDFQRYKNGAKTVTNFMVMPQGGVTARTGSKFIAETKDSSAVAHFIPFKFATTDAYMIEVGNQYMRFYKDSGLILNSDQSITNISQANPAVVTYSGADNFSNGDQIYITEVAGMTEVNSSTIYYTVANVDTGANTFELQDRDGNNVNSTGFTAYSSGGVINKIYEISTPYATADIPEIDFTQSGDVITLTHPDYQNRTLTRTSDTSWALATEQLVDGPYLSINSSTTTLTPSAKTGTITWTASAITGINDDTGFQTTDVGRLFRWYDRGPSKAITGITQANPGVITSNGHGYSNGDLVYITDVAGMTEINDRVKSYIVANVTANTFTLQDKDEVDVNTSAYTAYSSGGFIQSAAADAGTWHSILIASRSSTTQITGTIQNDTGPLSSIVPQLDWRMGAFSDTTGWPEKTTYYQQRLIYSKGEIVYGSAVDDFTNFAPGTNDSDAIEYTVASGEVNNIKWVSGGSRRLRIGTEGGILSLWGGSSNTAITPTNAVANIETTIRCKEVKPVSIGNSTLFLQRSGKVLRELIYSFDTDGLASPDISILSEDILGDKGDLTDLGITRMAYQQEPFPIIWCVKDNGEVAALTYDRDQEVLAWHNHVFGGSSVVVESVGVIPETGQDRVWFIVKRTINGVTRRYVEHLDTQFRNRSINTCIFSDSHLQFTGDKPAATLTPGATTGTSVTFTAGSSVFASTDVGRFIESSGAKARIDTYNSGTEVVCEILSDFASTSAIASGSWNLSVNSISGLDHLEGETVKVLCNGGVIPDQTVSSGAITLDGQYNYIGVGLGYNKDLETLDIDFGSAIGTAFGARSKVVDVFLEYFETVGGSIGYDSTQLTEILFREGDDNMGQGVGPLTGFKRLRPKGGWKDSIRTFYRNGDPLPVTILAMVIKGSINE